MTLEEIKQMPVTMGNLDKYPTSKMHESVMRSYHIVVKVRDLLERGTPNDVVIEIIDSLTQHDPTPGSPGKSR
tara:strand:+ start:247 stop:465 length:219 start_codon:yes stop_codon:yes gene_type:complete